jgi:hypothetical protein
MQQYPSQLNQHQHQQIHQQIAGAEGESSIEEASANEDEGCTSVADEKDTGSESDWSE